MSNKTKALKLAVSIIACLLAGFIGGIFTSSSVSTWYETLNKPSFSPPNWVFGPVWTLLYILMGISFYIVWLKSFKEKEVKKAAAIFAVQLLLNMLWSILFFGLKSPLAAFIEVVLLWLAICLTILQFSKISKPAAYLLVPYILWVSFASVLNLAIVLLN